MPLRSLPQTPLISRSHEVMLRSIADFISVTALIGLTGFQIFVFLDNESFDFYLTLLIIVSVSFNVIGLIAAVAYQRTVFTITFFFTLLFFGFAPLQQIIYHFDPIMENPSILARAFGFCFIFSAICLTALFVIGPAAPTREGSSKQTLRPFSPVSQMILLCVLCIAICTGFLSFGQALFTDRTTYSDLLLAENSQPIYLLYTGGLRPFTVYGSVVGLWLAYSHQRTSWCLAFGATLIGGLLLSNPLITPRFEVATLIYTILFYFGGRRHNRLLVLGLLIGVAIAPLFNLFRLEDVQLEQKDLGSFLVSGDFDAFSLLAHTIWHVDYHGLDYGNNILSAIFFFVPRALWPGKNEITPFYLMDSLHTYRSLWNTNLSEPLIAEGYFAFGLIGVVAMTMIYVCFAWFLEMKAGENRLRAIYLFCCASPPLLFILLRGSLIVAVAAIAGHFLAIAFAIKLADARFEAAIPMRFPSSRPLSRRYPPSI